MVVAAFMLCVFAMSPGAEAKKQINKKVDMANYTCKDLLSEKDDDVGTVLVWIDGYLSGKTGDTTIDIDFLGELAEGVGEACAEKKNAKVLDIVRDLTEN